MIRADNLQYLTAKKFNKSEDRIISRFDEYNPLTIDAEKGIKGIKIEKPNSVNYLFFSKILQKDQLESQARKILRQMHEAKAIQESIDHGKKTSKTIQD